MVRAVFNKVWPSAPGLSLRLQGHQAGKLDFFATFPNFEKRAFSDFFFLAGCFHAGQQGQLPAIGHSTSTKS